MATKTFSGRAEEERLSYADTLARQQFGMSFGQYCGTILLNVIYERGELPSPAHADDVRARRRRALQSMQGISEQFKHSEAALMDDAQIKELIASRYV